jgi:hypothetical protein
MKCPLADASAAGFLLGGEGLTEQVHDASVETCDRERSRSEGG